MMEEYKHWEESKSFIDWKVLSVPYILLEQEIANLYCIIGFTTHLMKRIEKGPVRGISLKLQEEVSIIKIFSNNFIRKEKERWISSPKSQLFKSATSSLKIRLFKSLLPPLVLNNLLTNTDPTRDHPNTDVAIRYWKYSLFEA